VPQAKVLHYGGQSTKQARTEMFLRLYETKVLYFRKHYGTIGASLYKLILLAAALARLLISPLAWFEQKPQRDEHLTLANHYRLLVQHLPSF
jgi:GT2 family glycosyltransferase